VIDCVPAIVSATDKAAVVPLSTAVPSKPCVDEVKLTVPVGAVAALLAGAIVAVSVAMLPVLTVPLGPDTLVVVAIVAVLACVVTAADWLAA
jgi:hypothetical protein